MPPFPSLFLPSQPFNFKRHEPTLEPRLYRGGTPSSRKVDRPATARAKVTQAVLGLCELRVTYLPMSSSAIIYPLAVHFAPLQVSAYKGHDFSLHTSICTTYTDMKRECKQLDTPRMLTKKCPSSPFLPPLPPPLLPGPLTYIQIRERRTDT